MNVSASHGPPRNNRTTIYSLLAAGMIVVMLITQLFGYEDFAAILSGILSINDARALSIISGAIVIGELMSLPYLLGMYLSKLMRFLSAIVALAISGFWLMATLTNAHTGNSGIFSSTLELPGGVIAAVWSLILLGLIVTVISADSRFRQAGS